ncbi:MAG: hypothetical protein QW273_02280 [Candidatus Pacearchaeota archaeon]
MKMKFCARAPSRVDFAGGTLDLPFFAEREEGATLNCGIAKYGYATIEKNDKFLEINSLNYNKRVKIDIPIKYNGDLDLLKAAFVRRKFFEKVTLTTYHEMKPHSRLGTSSSIAVATLGAIDCYLNKKINKKEIAETATKIEREELKMDNGPQDQYAASFGGILMLRYKKNKVSVEKLKLKEETIYQLEKNLILCYTGSKEVAGDVNHETVKNYLNGNEKVIDAIRNIKEITFSMYKSLKKGDLYLFAELLKQENENRKMLNDKILTPLCRRYIETGLKNGALGAKLLGAGAGGTILFYADDNKKEILTNSLEKEGARCLDFRFDFKGLTIWKEKF